MEGGVFDVVFDNVGLGRVEAGNLAAGFILSAYLEGGCIRKMGVVCPRHIVWLI